MSTVFIGPISLVSVKNLDIVFCGGGLSRETMALLERTEYLDFCQHWTFGSYVQQLTCLPCRNVFPLDYNATLEDLNNEWSCSCRVTCIYCAQPLAQFGDTRIDPAAMRWPQLFNKVKEEEASFYICLVSMRRCLKADVFEPNVWELAMLSWARTGWNLDMRRRSSAFLSQPLIGLLLQLLSDRLQLWFWNIWLITWHLAQTYISFHSNTCHGVFLKRNNEKKNVSFNILTPGNSLSLKNSR